MTSNPPPLRQRRDALRQRRDALRQRRDALRQRRDALRQRLDALRLGSLLSAAAAALLWSALPLAEPAQRAPLDPDSAAARMPGLLERGIDPDGVEWIPPRADSGLTRFRITSEIAALLRRSAPGTLAQDEFDPHAYYRSRPHLEVRHPWREHPGNEYRVRTNSLGLRRDSELMEERPALRILVTGDGHTEGICNNRESFSNLLEVNLTQRLEGQTVEVLNAARSGYSFYNHLGTLERFAPLAPDAAIVVVNGGNDFREVLAHHDLFTGNPPWRHSVVELEAFHRAARIHRPVLGQAWMTSKHFGDHPARAEVALEASLRIAREKQALAAEAGFELLIAYLPPITDLPTWGEREDFRGIAEILELSAEELALTDTLADRYLAALADLGIATLDLRPALRDHAPEAYWRKDLRLAPKGHRLAAEALLPRVLELLGEDPAHSRGPAEPRPAVVQGEPAPSGRR